MSVDGSDKSKPRPLPIVFDTSILAGIRLNKPPPEFRLLQRLSEAGKVRLLVPEMAAREWLSQRSEPTLAALDQLEASLRVLRRRPDIGTHHMMQAILQSDAHSEEAISALRTAVERWHSMQLGRLRLSVMELKGADYEKMTNDYFGGLPPFAAKKARQDIPDSLVLACAIRAFEEDQRTILACSDKRLRKAGQDAGMSVAQSLPDLLKLDAIAHLSSNQAFALWWERNFRDVIRELESDDRDLKDWLENDLVYAVANDTVRHSAIPEDNHEAFVEAAGDFTDIQFDWAAGESLGEGVLSVPMTFGATLELAFYVYRGDAFDVPDWVSVSIGDFEDDHYFEASGSLRGSYSARLVLEFGEDVMKGQVDLSRVEVSIEDPELEDVEE